MLFCLHVSLWLCKTEYILGKRRSGKKGMCSVCPIAIYTDSIYNSLEESPGGEEDITRIRVRKLTCKDFTCMTPWEGLDLKRIRSEDVTRQNINLVFKTKEYKKIFNKKFLYHLCPPSDQFSPSTHIGNHHP